MIYFHKNVEKSFNSATFSWFHVKLRTFIVLNSILKMQSDNFYLTQCSKKALKLHNMLRTYLQQLQFEGVFLINVVYAS